jgi:hypothetical protein
MIPICIGLTIVLLQLLSGTLNSIIRAVFGVFIDLYILICVASLYIKFKRMTKLVITETTKRFRFWRNNKKYLLIMFVKILWENASIEKKYLINSKSITLPISFFTLLDIQKIWTDAKSQRFQRTLHNFYCVRKCAFAIFHIIEW